LSNAEIANRLLSLAQLLAAKGENPFKIKAYRRAARTIADLGPSVEELVRDGEDLTRYPGIGDAIRDVIHEMVSTGSSLRLETLRATASPDVVSISEYPLLDPKRVRRIYKKLGISTIEALRQRLEAGEIGQTLGLRMEHHVRRALSDRKEMLWYEVEQVVENISDYLMSHCGVRRAEPVGEFRRKLEIVSELSFLVETEDFGHVVAKLKRYGGRADLVSQDEDRATLILSSGVTLKVSRATPAKWGVGLVETTGSPKHLDLIEKEIGPFAKLKSADDSFPGEEDVYDRLGLAFIPPELREGHNEIALAARSAIPELVSIKDIRGELHAHTVSSDGMNTIEEMAAAAHDRGLTYIGISDHSQSLKIAGGVSEEDLWDQIRYIDRLNERADGIRILKGAEVDILQDGSLDYSDALLKELDYTICSIHSRFGMGRTEQTERILRAMDNRYFDILGHATGRLLLKRPGYEIDIDRVIEQARVRGCTFELNSTPDRLDVSAQNARLIAAAGVKIAITTDAHSTRDFHYLRYGIDQARRAGLSTDMVLNHLDWSGLLSALKR
jgi:DNA polymerase (family X)